MLNRSQCSHPDFCRQAAGAEGLQHDADDVASNTWGPEARLREHLEAAAERQAKEMAKRDQAMRLLSDDVSGAPAAAAPLRTAFDALPPDGALPPQARARHSIVCLTLVLMWPIINPALRKTRAA